MSFDDAVYIKPRFFSPFGVLSQASGDNQLLAPSPEQNQEQGNLEREKNSDSLLTTLAIALFPSPRTTAGPQRCPGKEVKFARFRSN
jgi:hypothetical protein